jgi:ABC-2 type transport system ATP-binding protein
VGGQNPLENDAVLGRMIFVKESQVYPDIKVKRALEAASWFYPNWDAELAEMLMEDFALPANRAIKKLSRGMHSSVGIVIGLASRAEITLFDEPYLGLDAVARQIFYDRLCRAPAHRAAVHPPHRRGGEPARARCCDRPRAHRCRCSG